jgi:hypothetical protein
MIATAPRFIGSGQFQSPESIAKHSQNWTSRDSVDTFSALSSGLKFFRTHAPEMAVASRLIVELVDVFRDICLRNVSGRLDSFLMRSFFRLLKKDSTTALTLLCQVSRAESARSARISGYSALTRYRFRHRCISLLDIPSAVRRSTYARVRGSLRIPAIPPSAHTSGP